jgi:hypothetical protein
MVDDTTDIPTEGITTDTTITGITIGTGLGLSASTGAQVITAIGKQESGSHCAYHHPPRASARNWRHT